MTQRPMSVGTLCAFALLSVAFAVSAPAQSTEWKEYASEKGKFSALLPGAPETGYRLGPSVFGAVMSYVTNYQKDAKAWSVVYFDLPAIPPDADAVKKLFERERDSYTAKPSGEKSLTLNGHPALEFKTPIDDRDRVQVVRIILVKQRVYELWVVTQARHAASEDVTRFFDSFKPAPLTDEEVVAAAKAAMADKEKAVPRKLVVSSGVLESRAVKKVQPHVDGAMADFNKALELNPKDGLASYQRGVMRFERGDNDGAISDFDKTIEFAGKVPMVYYNRGMAKQAKEKHAEAIPDFTKSIEIDPKFTDGYYARGLAYQTLGKNAEALADYDKCLELKPQFFEGLYNRATLRLAADNLEGAISDYTQALSINPRDHDCYFYRAQARERKGDLEAAAGDYGKVIELNPQSAEAYAGRGILRLYQKKDAEAKADFDQCLKLNPAMKESLNRRIVYAKYQRDKKKR